MTLAQRIRLRHERVMRGWIWPLVNVVLPVAAFMFYEARRAWPSVLAAATLGVAGAAVFVLVGG